MVIVQRPHTYQTLKLALITQGGMLSKFSESSFGGSFLCLEGVGAKLPSPLPSPSSRQSCALPRGLVRNLARRGGGEGGRSSRVGTGLCWRPCVITPFFFALLVPSPSLIISHCSRLFLSSFSPPPSPHSMHLKP